MPISESNKTDSLDRSENVICNGLATSDSYNYKARVDDKNRLHVNGLSPYVGRCIVDINTTALSTSFQDVLNLTGSGELSGFKFKFTNNVVRVRLEIDGVESFDVDIDQVRSCEFSEYNNTGLNRIFGTEQYGEFEFFPNIPWQFKTSLKVQVRKTVSWTVNQTRRVLFYAV